MKSDKNVTKTAERVQTWIIQHLEANDQIVTKAITSDAFKSHPDDFKHVCIRLA